MLSPELKTIDTQVQTSFSSSEEELKKLREDKEILEGKIRGYLTLSEICHEYKEELRKLQAEYNKLLQKEQMKAKHLYSESPAPEPDLDRPTRPDLEQRTTKNPNPSSTAAPKSIEIATELTHDKQIRTSELFDQGMEKAQAHSGNDNDLNRNTTSMNIIASGKYGQSEEKFPMQESLAGEEALMQQPGSSHPSRSLTGLGFDPSSSGEMALGQSAGNYRPVMENADLMKFSIVPSLNAKELNQNPAELETVLRSIKDIEDSSLGSKVALVVKDYTEKREASIIKLKKANVVLIDKNNQLSKKLQMTEKDYNLVLARVRKLEQEKYEMTPSRSRSPDDPTGWVHVEKVTKSETQQSSDITEEEARRLEQLQLHPNEKLDDLKWLQTHYRQLREANLRWSEEWDKLKYNYDQRVKDIEDERDCLEKTLTEKKLLEESRQRDFDRAMSQLHEKASEEEKGKEEALLQLTTCNNRLEQMQRQIAELSDKNAALRREKQAKDSELQVLRQGISPTRAAPGEPSPSPSPGVAAVGPRAVESLRTENAVLHQQLVVFQEDFERERQDRASAQSMKDDYKKQNSELKKRCRHTEQKLANVERQMKQAEETSRRTLNENERLQQELTDLKNQQRRREEELNRTLLTAQPYLPQAPPIVQSAGLHPPTQPVYASPQMQQQHYMPQPQQPQQQPQYQLQMPQYQAAVGGYMGPPAGSQAAPARPLAGSQYTQAATNQQQVAKATEHLPGSWSCNQCTYVNYPGRTVCEMCGYIQSPTSQNNFRYPTNGSDILLPRGDEAQQRRATAYPQYNYQPGGQQNLPPNPGNHAV